MSNLTKVDDISPAAGQTAEKDVIIQLSRATKTRLSTRGVSRMLVNKAIKELQLQKIIVNTPNDIQVGKLIWHVRLGSLNTWEKGQGIVVVARS